jgi:hypothetical protein
MAHMLRARQQVMTCLVTHGTKALADQTREWRLDDRVQLAGLPALRALWQAPRPRRSVRKTRQQVFPSTKRGSGADTRI